MHRFIFIFTRFKSAVDKGACFNNFFFKINYCSSDREYFFLARARGLIFFFLKVNAAGNETERVGQIITNSNKTSEVEKYKTKMETLIIVNLFSWY